MHFENYVSAAGSKVADIFLDYASDFEHILDCEHILDFELGF